MNDILPLLFFALLCIMRLPTSLSATDASESLEEDASRDVLQFGATNDYYPGQSASSSAFTLPSRSDIVSALLRRRTNNRNVSERQADKFSSLNKILSQISLRLPDAKVSRSGLDLTITEITCRDLNVGDIELAHSIESNTSQNLNVDISGLALRCDFTWKYKWSFFNGGGSGMARLDDSSSASLDLRFESEDYDTRPPDDVSIPHCGPDIQIADMDFDGDGLGIIGGIMNLFEGLLRDTVEGELGDTVCDELRGMGDSAFDDLLVRLGEEIGTYLEPLEGSLTDPLSVENNMAVIPMIEDTVPMYLNFQELDVYAGEWINSALDQANNFFLGPSESAVGELGINTFLRDNILNENGEFVLDPSLFFENGVVFEGHDMLTETTLSLQSINIQGIDSFKEMDLMKAIGKHTLQNKLKLDHLSIVAEMEAEMKASSKSNSVVVMNGNNVSPITENFTVEFSVTNIDIDASVFLGINVETLGNLELGSLLHSKDIIPCLLSAIDEAKFSGLSVTVQDMVPPKLSGFIDYGIDHLISTAAAALFDMYENVLIKAMPNFLEMYVRDMMNDFAENALDADRCPKIENVEEDRYVDFRDMFYDQADAALAGGSGDGRYGNVIPWVMNIIDDQFLSADDDGLLAINDMLIAPLTKSQSGTEGTFKLNGTFVDLNKEEVTLDIWQAFADNLRLTLSDLSISGLDTLKGPMKLLEPRTSSAHLLENQLSLGIPNKPLDASFQFGIDVGDETSPLATHNIMDLQFSMPSMEVLAVMFATVQESRLMKFPLKDMFNFSCWLSMIPVSTKSSGINVGLAMHYLDLIFDILSNTECVSCSNTWLEDLNSIVQFLDKNNFTSELKSRAISIASDLLEGDWVQGMVDKEISQASQRCPHDAAFGSSQIGQAHSPFKATRSFVDGVLYAAFPLVQVIAVALAQKHSNLEIAPPVDVKLDIPNGAKLIDLTDLSSVASWADMALGEVRSYLGGNVDDSQDLGITSMLQSLILDDNGLLTIPIVDEGFDAGGVKLSLYDVTLVGLDSFTVFEVLKTSGPSMFSNSVKLQRLGVTVKMGLSVEDEDSNQARMLAANGININEMETITVSLILKDVNLDVSLLMAMDQDLMGELQLGSILDTNNILNCLLSTIHSLGLSKFVMDVGDIEEFSISGFISEDTNNSIKSMTEAIFASEYKSVVLDAFPAFTSITIRPILHDIMRVLVDKARDDGACPEPDSTANGILDWRDLLLSEGRAMQLFGRGNSPYGNLFRMIFGVLENMMSEADDNGLSQMNDLVTSLTERQSNVGGDLYYPGDIFKQDLDVALNGLNAAIELGVSDVRVSNLNSIGAPIKVLQPVKGESSILDNTASIGAGSEALRAEFRLLIKGKGNEVEVHNELMLGLSLKNVDMMLELLAQVEELPFFNFPLQDVLNLQCWLATVVTPALNKYGIREGERDTGIVLQSLALAVAEARLDIECIECSSPMLIEMSDKLGSPEAVDDTTDVANMVLDYISNLLGGSFVQNQLDLMLNEAAMKCPHSPSYNQNFASLKYDEMDAIQTDEDAYGFLIAIIAVIAISAVFAVITIAVARYVSRRRHNRWMSTLTRAQKLDLEELQTNEKKREKGLNSRMKSLVRSAEVPLFIRLFIPVVILGNIALFLSGHLSIGGTVNISGSFAGQSFDVDKFFEFSMAKSTIEMWNAGAKSLAIMIVIFSGVWPYSKLLTTFVIWFTPPRWLSSKRRGSILHWLDVLGKWSMVDVFVLLMTLASFHLSVQSPDQLSFLPESLYSINMLVVPLWGLYANMLAQLVAQISSHVIIHYHRKTVRSATCAQQVEMDLAPDVSDKTPEKLQMHRFKLDYEASSKRAMVKRSVNWILSATLLSFVILVVCGCGLPSFSIEVLGLVGLAVESGNQFEQANVLYSVFDLAAMIMDQGRYLNTASDLVGLGTLASLLVITVFIVPLFQAVSLLAQWFAPLTKKQRLQNAVLNEMLSAWQYMEVYVLSIVIAAWQLGGVSEYMINAYCGSLKETFASLAYHGVLREEDAQCFRVNAGVEAASWILVAASLILCILNHFIVGASTQKAQDDDTPSHQRFHSDMWLQRKQSTVAIGMTMSDEEDSTEWLDLKEPSVSPVKPRFTDYFFYATRHSNEEGPPLSTFEIGEA